MRRILALPSSQPSGWGFLIQKRRVAAVAIIAGVLAGGAVPARAANVSVTLRLSVGAYSAAVKTCAVTVPSGATGGTVLSNAVAQGCIAGYETDAGGAYVTCVDPGAASICQIGDGLVTFWAVYEDGRTSEIGIGGFHAAAGKELGLSYTNFLTCPTYPDCPL